ncbi:hypothetical protein TK5_01580 [Sideroxyarcus sp. TK5]
MRTAFELDSHLTGRMTLVTLNAHRLHAAGVHRRQQFGAQCIVAGTGDEDGIQAEGLEVSGDVEGRAAEDAAVREDIGEDLAE